MDVPYLLFLALQFRPVWAAFPPPSVSVSQGDVDTEITRIRSRAGADSGLGPGAVHPCPRLSASASEVVPLFEVRLKPNGQGRCPPVPWLFGATFSLGKVPVFISKNHISLNGAICFKCLPTWRLPHLTIGIIKGTGLPFQLLVLCSIRVGGWGPCWGVCRTHARIPPLSPLHFQKCEES